MRIRTIKNNVCCLSEFKNNRYEISDVCIDECGFDHDVAQYVQQLSEAGKCLSTVVDLQEKFFFSLSRFFKGSFQERCDCIGFLSKDQDVFVLNIEKIINGNKLYPELHHRFLVTPLIPDKLFFTGEFSRSILTSDGVITLEQNQFIGVRDGLIEELDVQEVLEIISNGETETSPLFSSLRLKPVSKRPSRPRTGTIIYNKNNNKIEAYNGKDWTEL